MTLPDHKHKSHAAFLKNLKVKDNVQKIGQKRDEDWKFSLLEVEKDTDAEQKELKMSSLMQVSMRDIFRFMLKRTYEEMRELNLIEDKLATGSPRTV